VFRVKVDWFKAYGLALSFLLLHVVGALEVGVALEFLVTDALLLVILIGIARGPVTTVAALLSRRAVYKI
jgi:hypothetical protein